jgi:mRNA interferase MazF
VLRGEVFWARLPEPVGRRPVVVVQNNTGNRFSPSTIVAVISTSPPEAEYPFLAGLDSRLLGEPCWIHCETILTIPQTILQDKLGSLGRQEIERVDQALKLSLGLH